MKRRSFMMTVLGGIGLSVNRREPEPFYFCHPRPSLPRGLRPGQVIPVEDAGVLKKQKDISRKLAREGLPDQRRGFPSPDVKPGAWK